MAASSPRKFEELVLYIAEQTKDDPTFGRTKLAKVMFYSEIEAYRLLGAAITGATYYKWDRGPYPKRLGGTVTTLTRSGATLAQRGTDEYDSERLIPTGKRRSDLASVGISHDQIAIVDQCIAHFRKATAGQIKRIAHDHPGYQIASKDQAIPLDSAFLALAPPSNASLERAKRIATERGWLAEGRWQRR